MAIFNSYVSLPEGRSDIYTTELECVQKLLTCYMCIEKWFPSRSIKCFLYIRRCSNAIEPHTGFGLQPPPRTSIGSTNHDCHSGGEVVVFVAVVAVVAVGVGVVVVFLLLFFVVVCCCCCCCCCCC